VATESVRIRYRPLRLGWCVREGNWDDLRSVLRSAQALWGGVFNPILSIGDADHAAHVVRAFEVDALFPAADDPLLRTFADRFSHLRWPSVHRTLFIQGSGGRGLSTFLDIYHPVRSIYEEHIDGKLEPRVTATLYEWAAGDPLEHVFLAQFGAYPPQEEIRLDYAGMVERHLKGTKVTLPVDGPVPSDAYRQLTASVLSLVLNCCGTVRRTGIFPGFT
jgi:hypothetical protein